jgi:hypothetical protein
MTGKLIKLNNIWHVKSANYWDDRYFYYTLHPDDVKQIEQDSYQFDNIEARIAAYPDVEFNIISEYAKLIPKIKEESWDDIYEEYSKDEYPAFGGPFTHAMTFIEWLKLNYNSPIKKSTK